MDSKLKKGKTQIQESEFDKLFDQSIGLFRHLKDKDLFEKYYKTHLAKVCFFHFNVRDFYQTALNPMKLKRVSLQSSRQSLVINSQQNLKVCLQT